MRRRPGGVPAAIAGLALSACAGCGGGAGSGEAGTAPPAARPSPGPGPEAATTTVRFVDVTEPAGIRFRHENGAFGAKYLPETMGSGVAFLDFDGDGWLDILFANAVPWPGRGKGAPPTPALYRNRGDGRFEDVTVQAGLALAMYGMGIAPGTSTTTATPTCT